MNQKERMDAAATDALLRRFKRKPIFDPADAAGSMRAVDYGPDVVRRLLPHRSPLLLVDRLIGIDLDAGRIAGLRTLDAADPVFGGHFPGSPIYPGSLQVEMVGQLGLCLHYFTRNHTYEPPPVDVQLAVRATRILGAYYGEPLEPGAAVTLVAEVISFDGYFASMIGQCLVGDRVASVSAGEVLFL